MKVYYLSSIDEYFYVVCFAHNEKEAIRKANKRYLEVEGTKFRSEWLIEEFTRDTYDGALAFY